MIHSQLIDPKSIVVVGASNHLGKPGGKLFHNLLSGTFRGELYALHPTEKEIQGRPAFADVRDLPCVDLAFLAVPAAACPALVKALAEEKSTKAFVVVSAGFSEESPEGAVMERQMVEICRKHDAVLIGPNCIGVMTPAYQGVFTLPIPRLVPDGCDFISGSGATAVFIMESGLQKGLSFNQVFSVGNSAQTGVEDVLAHLDESFDPKQSSRVKLLYFETIKNPRKLLVHASSLISKGCRIAAVKAGSTDAGSRAASSHTGALANSDTAVDALFRKAGIVRCHGREDLTTVASVMQLPPLQGKNLAIITHAGGPAVMLTDTLAKGGLDVPRLEGPRAEELLSHLFPGSSVANPIDLLATGNAAQVDLALEYCENHFPEVDGVVVIFGTPGLAPVFDVYDVLDRRIRSGRKPIYPVLPSVVTASREVEVFLSKGHLNFPDEVLLGEALVRLAATPLPARLPEVSGGENRSGLRTLMEEAGDGYLSPREVGAFLDLARIPRVREVVVGQESGLQDAIARVGFPLVMKVIGPVHKSDVGGVVLNLDSETSVLQAFERMKAIDGWEGVLLQSMERGMEFFLGATREKGFGHVILCGMGGVFVEVLQDVRAGLGPLGPEEAHDMIASLKAYPLLKGTRGQVGVNIQALESMLVGLSEALAHCPEIAEMDLNPVLSTPEGAVAVDARIRVQKGVV